MAYGSPIGRVCGSLIFMLLVLGQEQSAVPIPITDYALAGISCAAVQSRLIGGSGQVWSGRTVGVGSNCLEHPYCIHI